MSKMLNKHQHLLQGPFIFYLCAVKAYAGSLFESVTVRFVGQDLFGNIKSENLRFV